MIDLGYSAYDVSGTRVCPFAGAGIQFATIGGIIYVVEGAILGGAQIDRAACELLGADDPAGRRYWSWCRSAGRERWPLALSYIEAQVASGAQTDELKNGALATFRALSHWLAPLDRTDHDARADIFRAAI